MTLDALLRDETLRRHEFPVCKQKIFLAHAGVSPLPRRVAEAMQQYVAAAAQDDQEDALPEQIVRETRQLAARLIESHEDEIAFVGSTSMGLAMVAAGLSWRPGDNVVCYRDDYPANVYPWMDLARRGVEVRFVEPRQYGNVTVEDLDPIVDENTRLVALASVHFVSGWRLDVDRIGRYLKGRGILFCLDGIQSFGALRTSMQWVDFAAADAHKWLLGPLGAALLYVRREHFDRLHPALVGWRSASCPEYVAQQRLAYWPNARRYEPGSLNLVGIVGLHAALGLISELGIDAIENRVLGLARYAIEVAERKDFGVLGPREGPGISGIVSLTGRIDSVELSRKFSDQGVAVSVRKRRDGSNCLRLSAHFYNTEQEIEFASRLL